MVAGGMESMSNAPYALTQARTGYRMGNGKMIDVMIHDGLWDPYGDKHMGTCAEACASKYKFTREEQDEFSRESYRRAQDAIKTGRFKREIAVVEVPGRKGPSVIIDDEEPFSAPLEKMGTLKPAFQKDGGASAPPGEPAAPIPQRSSGENHGAGARTSRVSPASRLVAAQPTAANAPRAMARSQPVTRGSGECAGTIVT
ncbi:MAG: hypothetical protein ABIO78_03610 [Thermoanaerobaculia bacterium]